MNEEELASWDAARKQMIINAETLQNANLLDIIKQINYIDSITDSELLTRFILDASKRFIELKHDDQIRSTELIAPLTTHITQPIKIFRVTIES
jgi:hypothetical protein